jgi:hypothetical protein
MGSSLLPSMRGWNLPFSNFHVRPDDGQRLTHSAAGKIWELHFGSAKEWNLSPGVINPWRKLAQSPWT